MEREENPAEKHRRKFLELAGRIHHLRFQGKHLRWTVKQPDYRNPPKKKKGALTAFSPASRLRLLSLMCQIEYEKIRPGLFVTLTYPDGWRPSGKEDANEHRRKFWRHAEEYLGRETCGLWRLEWEVRKSGPNIGRPYPHYHLLVFKEQYWDVKVVRHWWGMAIGHIGPLIIQVQRMVNEKQCGWYVAKYVGKNSDSLVIGLNLEGRWSGRQWGVHRRNLIPFYPVLDVQLPSDEFMDSLYAYGLEGRELLTDWGSQSYQVLGGKAEVMQKLLRDYLLDSESGEEYIG